jgi:hypothetical protein
VLEHFISELDKKYILNLLTNISSELKRAVLASHTLKLFMRKILHHLLVMIETVALSTIYSVIIQKKEEDT